MAQTFKTGILITGDARGGVRALNLTQREIKDLERQQKSSIRTNKQHAQSTTAVSKSMDRALLVAKATAAAYATLAVVRVADQYKLLDARVRLATEATGDYNSVSSELYAITQRNGAALQESVNLFAQLARSAPELGASNSQILQLTDNVQKLGVVSGASQDAMTNSLRQFSQAMAGGVLRAEEWNAIVENTPAIAQAIADGMGKTVGEMRQMVVAGKALSKDVFEALLSQTDEINRMFAEMPLTIDRSLTMLSNSVTRIVGKLNETVDVSGGLAKIIQDIALSLDEISADPAALQSILDWLERLAVAGTALVGAKIFLRLGSHIAGVVTAMRGAAGVAGLLRGALGLLGGPVGVATVAGVALYELYQRVREGDPLVQRLTTAYDNYLRALKATPAEAEKAAAAVVSAYEEQISYLEGRLSRLDTGLPQPDELPEGFRPLPSFLGANVQEDIDQTRASLDKATDSLRDFNAEADSALRRRAFADSTSQTIGATAAKTKSQLDALIDSMREEAAADRMSAKEKFIHAAEQEALKQGLEAFLPVIRQEAAALFESQKAWRQRQEELKAAADAQRDMLIELEEYFEEEARLNRESEAARRKALEEQVNALTDSLRTEEEAIEASYKERLDLLQQAHDEQLPIIGGFEQAKLRLHEDYQRELLDLEEQTTDEMARIWGNAIDNMQEAFGDLVYGALWEDGIRSFDDFTDALLNIWKRMIAEMIAVWVTSGIVGILKGQGFGGFSLGNLIGGLGGGGGGAGNVAAGIGKAVASGLGHSATVGVAAREVGRGIAAAFGAEMVAGTATTGAAIGDMFAAATAKSIAAQSAAVGGSAAAGGAAAAGSGAMAQLAAGGPYIAALAGLVFGAKALFGGPGKRETARNRQYAEGLQSGEFGGREALGDLASIRGEIENVNGELDRAFITVTEHLHPGFRALQEAGFIEGMGSALRDELGQHLIRVTADTDLLRAAFDNAALSSAVLVSGLEKQKGELVSLGSGVATLKGDTEAWLAVLRQGPGAFQVISDASGQLTVRLQGDIVAWNQFLQQQVAQSTVDAARNFANMGQAGAAAGNQISQAVGQTIAVTDDFGRRVQVNMQSLINSGRGAVNALNGIANAVRGIPTNVTTTHTIVQQQRFERADPEGRHADGLAFVPHDGYMAELHFGERVLTAFENQNYNRRNATASVIDLAVVERGLGMVSRQLEELRTELQRTGAVIREGTDQTTREVGRQSRRPQTGRAR